MTEAEDLDENIMDWRIIPQAPGHHQVRGRDIIAYCQQMLFVGDVPIALLQLEDGCWYVMAECEDYDHQFGEVGPFAKLDEAMVFFRLIGER